MTGPSKTSAASAAPASPAPSAGPTPWLAAGALVLACGLLAVHGAGEAEAKGKSVGTINYLEGNATRSASRGKEVTLQKGAALFEGDRIKTADATRLEAKLLDGSMVRLGPKSELALDDLSFGGKRVKKVKLKLVVGKVWAAVRSLFGDDARFEVETSNAVAGVRGTRFSASQGEGGDTLVKVYSGKVLVSNRPIYAVEGHTKGKRVQVAGPQEITKEQWTELVAGAMQMIRVAQSGQIEQPQAFEMAQAGGEDAAWEAWNAERDQLAKIHE